MPSIRHTKVSVKPDGPDSSLILPSDWNADHDGIGIPEGGDPGSFLGKLSATNGDADWLSVVNASPAFRRFLGHLQLGSSWLDISIDGVLAGDSNFSLNLATDAVNLLSGQAVIAPSAPTLSETERYFASFIGDTDITSLFAAPDPTDPRIDLVCLTITDLVRGTIEFQVIEGTPDPAPTPPAAPDDALPLWTVTVPAAEPDQANWTADDIRIFVTLGTQDIASVLNNGSVMPDNQSASIAAGADGGTPLNTGGSFYLQSGTGDGGGGASLQGGSAEIAGGANITADGGDDDSDRGGDASVSGGTGGTGQTGGLVYVRGGQGGPGEIGGYIEIAAGQSDSGALDGVARIRLFAPNGGSVDGTLEVQTTRGSVASLGLPGDRLTGGGGEGPDLDTSNLVVWRGGQTPDLPVELEPVDYLYTPFGTGAVIQAYTYDDGADGVGATVTQNDPTTGYLSIDGSGPLNAIATSDVLVGFAGAGYAPGDTFAIVGGDNNNALGTVDTVDGGGGVLAYHLTAAGTGYAVQSYGTTVLTGGGDGILNIDVTAVDTGPRVTPGQRVLFYPGHALENGVYTVTEAGDGVTVPWVMTRAGDCDEVVKRARYWAVGILSGNVWQKGSGRVTWFSGGSLDMALAALFSRADGYSTASGYASMASGATSTASGTASTASGIASTASGDASTASGYASTASGYGSTASGYGSTASGDYSTASGASIASGVGSIASGSSTASGYLSTASGVGTIASGIASVASGVGSVASGDDSTASGDHANAWSEGQRAHASGGNLGQHSLWALSTRTTDGTPTDLQVILPDYARTFIVRARIVGRRIGVGEVTTSELNIIGSGYAPTDTFVLDGGNGDATGEVDTVGGSGDIETYHLTAGGTGYTPGIYLVAPTSGTGDGASIIVTGIARPDIEDSAWDLQGVLRGDGDTAYSWVGGSAPVASIIGQDAAAAAWAVAIGVTGLDLQLTVTGEVGKTIDWNWTLELDEVG